MTPRVDLAQLAQRENEQTEDAERRILVFIQPATGSAHTCRRGTEGAKHYVRVSRSTIEARNGLLRDLLVRTRALEPWDRRPCKGATANDLDLLAIRDALQRMGLTTIDRSIDPFLNDGAQLSPFVPSLCITEPLTKILRPRNFAMLLFGREPQRFIPGAFSVFSSYRGVDRTSSIARKAGSARVYCLCRIAIEASQFLFRLSTTRFSPNALSREPLTLRDTLWRSSLTHCMVVA